MCKCQYFDQFERVKCLTVRPRNDVTHAVVADDLLQALILFRCPFSVCIAVAIIQFLCCPPREAKLRNAACLSIRSSVPFTLSANTTLHWLPIRQRVMYKLRTIVHKCLHAAAPPYLSELCIPVSTSAGRHFLRSATYGDLLVPRTSTSTYGPRSFAVSGPSVRNKLPATLHVSPTLGQFQSKLKAILFRSAYETWLGAFMTD